MLDVLLCAVMLLPWIVASIVVASTVYLALGRPVFFRQIRRGLRGQEFVLVKFRTMSVRSGPEGDLRGDQERRSCVGDYLRNSGLDELPEIWNILRGDMSWVGPRPLLSHYWERYTERERRRHEVKPGLTGWAQVNVTDRNDWSEKLELDLWYVENKSVWLDLCILFKTAVVFVKGLVGIERDRGKPVSEFGTKRRKSLLQ